MTAPAPSQSKALRRIFLAVFLRGRAGRALRKEEAPKSIGSKLLLTLLFYSLFGCFAAFFATQPIFSLSVYLHASTMMFIGMFVASSAGEALFNKEEADILLHRPVSPRALLWAKLSVMTQISLWLAFSFNLVGLVIGALKAGWLFPVAHVMSIVIEALFCVGLVIVTYQLCLRWFGRERLDGIITTMQTAMAILVVLGSQIAPQVLMRHGNKVGDVFDAWWIYFLPPAWFAGFVDAISGSGSGTSWLMAAMATVVTAILLILGFGTLSGDYASGLQTMQENTPARPGRRGLWLERLTRVPLMRWWLRDPATRAAFVLSFAYLIRDRDVKLRVYPGIAPMMMMPIIFLMPNRGAAMMGDFGAAFSGAYIGMLPMMALSFLKYSQQWQAADIFRTAPMIGPGALCHGARKAVFVMITLPIFFLILVAAFIFSIDWSLLVMLLPGIIVLPIFSAVPCLGGDAAPLSQPAEEAKQASRGLYMIVAMVASLLLAGIAIFARQFGLLPWFLLVETVLASLVYALICRRSARTAWKPLE